MKIAKSIQDLRSRRLMMNDSVGFVPTMGALHQGHLSLVEESQKHNDFTVVSIFVNPTQFNNSEDLDKYPDLIAEDIEKLEQKGVDLLYLPDFEQIYPDDYRYLVSESSLSQKYCGASRKGHFDGVLTVVMKLLNLVQAQNAYFGLKDYQQFHLIKGMAEAFFMQTKICACPIIREEDGLAMSSRNLRLTQEQRAIAANFYKILSNLESLEEKYKQLEAGGFKVDYLEVLDDRLLAAVFLGEIRLIDNVEFAL